MTVRRAIEIIDKSNQCDERKAIAKCDYLENDCCYDCVFYVTPKQYCTAVDTLHKFAKSIKRRFEKL